MNWKIAKKKENPDFSFTKNTPSFPSLVVQLLEATPQGGTKGEVGVKSEGISQPSGGKSLSPHMVPSIQSLYVDTRALPEARPEHLFPNEVTPIITPLAERSGPPLD